MRMRFAFAFSLQGTDPKYTRGVERNLTALQRYFGSDAMMLLYGDVNPGEHTNLEWMPREAKGDTSCHFWRFAAVCDTRFDRVCVRDIDSVVSEREVAAVLEWESSGLGFHCMRDHYWHTTGGGAPFPVQGGMWGAMPARVPKNFGNLLAWWVKNKGPFQRYSDMWFLNRYIYPHLLVDGMQHDGCDSHWGGRNFPTPRVGSEYVGEYA